MHPLIFSIIFIVWLIFTAYSKLGKMLSLGIIFYIILDFVFVALGSFLRVSNNPGNIEIVAQSIERITLEGVSSILSILFPPDLIPLIFSIIIVVLFYRVSTNQ